MIVKPKRKGKIRANAHARLGRALLRMDPTRTTTLRRAFERELTRRFARIRLAIYDQIVRDDALGLLRAQPAWNAFCPTGEGGGVDPSCGKGGGGKRIKLAPTKAPPQDPDGLQGPYVQPPFPVQRVTQKEGERQNRIVSSGRKGTLKPVKLSSLVATQSAVRKNTVEYMAKERGAKGSADYINEPIRVIQYGNKYHIVDGHHRATAEALKGSQTVEALVYKDKKRVRNVANAPNEWRFDSDPEKVRRFQAWLKRLFREQLRADPNDADAYWRRYVEEGFKRGAGRAFQDVRSRGAGESADFYRGTRDEFLRSAFGQPESVEKVKLLASRTYDEVSGLTERARTVLGRELTDGLVEGKHPNEIAEDLFDKLDVEESRAKTIARTEIIRAHAEGQLVAMKALGVEQLGVMVEWSTAGDDAVCPECEPMEGAILTLDEARGRIPMHPNCRCAWIPANVGEEEE